MSKLVANFDDYLFLDNIKFKNKEVECISICLADHEISLVHFYKLSNNIILPNLSY